MRIGYLITSLHGMVELDSEVLEKAVFCFCLVLGQVFSFVAFCEIEYLLNRYSESTCRLGGFRHDGKVANPKGDLGATCRILRNWVLPFFYFSVLFSKVYFINSVLLRIVYTFLAVALISTCFSLVDDCLFIGASRSSWRGRVPRVAVQLCRWFVVVIGFIVTLSIVWGVDVVAVFVSLGIGSFVVGLAFQDTLSNIFSGITVLLAHPFDEGDCVEIDGVSGTVSEIGWRSIKLCNEGKTFIIPHQKVAQCILKKH